MNQGNIDNIISVRQRQSLDRLLRSHIRAFRRRQDDWNIQGWAAEEQVLPSRNVPIFPTVAMTTFISDPFEGDINPGETNGQKLFTLATAERSKDSKIVISQENAATVMNLLRQDSNSFGWSILTGCISNSAGTMLSILENSHLLTLDLVKKQAARTFFDLSFDINLDLPDPLVSSPFDPASGDADHLSMFYRRSRSRMIAKRLQNSLTATSWTTLFSKRKHFTWTAANGTVSYDGPTMLFIIVSGINPSTRVGVSDLKTNLRQAKLASFQYHVIDMTDKMMADYQLILEKNGRHDDMVLDLYTALLSGKNEIFSSFIQRRKDDWETGTDESHEALVKVANTKYNNMVTQGSWKQVEAKDSAIVALLTKVNHLEKQLKSSASASSSSSAAGKSSKNPYFTLDPWRMNKDGDTKVVDGKTWYWCPRHVLEGVYDGLYVTHPPGDHDAWADRKRNWRKNKSSSGQSSSGNASGANPSSTDRLTLSNNLKAAMVTNFQCTSEQAERLWSEVVQDSVK